MEQGQKIFVKPIGNRARFGDKKIIESTVCKIGKKYFYIEDLPNYKFDFKTMTDVSNYSPIYKAYNSVKEIEDEQELNKLHKEIWELFRYKNELSLNALRQIKEIIDLEKL